MITDEEILAIANPYKIDGKEYRFYHGCELIQFAKTMYVLGKQSGFNAERDAIAPGYNGAA